MIDWKKPLVAIFKAFPNEECKASLVFSDWKTPFPEMKFGVRSILKMDPERKAVFGILSPEINEIDIFLVCNEQGAEMTGSWEIRNETPKVANGH